VPGGKVLATFPSLAADQRVSRHGTSFQRDGKRLLVLGNPNNSNTSSAAFVYDTEKLAPIGPPIPYTRGKSTSSG